LHRADRVALSDVAAAAATVLQEGPTKHHGKDDWMSTEALSSRMVWKKPFGAGQTGGCATWQSNNKGQSADSPFLF
jgi:hypothetical protein